VLKGTNHTLAFLVTILIFQNLFNAGSPYITFGLNACAAIALFIGNRGRVLVPNGNILAALFSLIVWLLIIAVYRGDIETQTLLKYTRSALNITLLAVIIGTTNISPRLIIKGLSISLGFHVILVIAQLIFPNLSFITAPIFGFEREATILEQYTLRKLGASSSYDTASLLSVVAIIFFYFKYRKSPSTVSLLMIAASFLASLLSSRTGIAFSVITVSIIFIQSMVRAKGFYKLFLVSIFSGVALITYITLLPIVLHTLGLSHTSQSEPSELIAQSDYGTTGTLDALTNEHLKPLDQPLKDLAIGYAIDPNSINRFTDIGYVKLIYHIGIIGTIFLILIHLYMFAQMRRYSHSKYISKDERLLTSMGSIIIFLLLAFNYKSLSLYSRGMGDLIFFIFIYVSIKHRAKFSQNGNSKRSIEND
jgi:hypothetical protein